MNPVKNQYTKKREVVVFKAIAIFLPFLVIVLLEVTLRIFHYGYRTDLFVEYPQNTDYLVFNRHASGKYFTDPAFAPSGNTELFRKKKQPGTLRFFVLGESTTIGFPYFHNGSFHRWLLYRLMHTYPDSQFEIINLSLTAVNSYTVSGFAREVANYEPDAVLIYAGQNEYYGVLGVASTQSVSGSPAFVSMMPEMREFKMVQLLTNGYARLRKHTPEDAEKTRMELMVGDQHIPYKSLLFERGLNQFRYNMNRALAYLSKKNIPVFFSNLVSNVKDLPPFISDESHSAAAKSYYQMGDSLYQAEKYREAGEYFLKAKDSDPLRFRAPEELNTIIRELCNQFSHIYLVDTKSVFEQYSPHQILGDELFTDHVHPNLKGYALMAGAFYGQMSEAGLFPPSPLQMTEDEWWQEMPTSPIDSIAGECRIMQLKAHWPFNDPAYNRPIPENTVEEKLAAHLFRRETNWLEVHNTLYLAYLKLNQPEKAAKVSEGAVLEYAEDAAFYEKAAMISGELGHTGEAAFYLKKSFEMAPSFEKARYLMVFYLMMDEPEMSLPFLHYAIENNRSGLNLDAFKLLVWKVIEQKQALAEEPTNSSLMNEIATTYLQMDNKVGALKYTDEALRINPRSPEALNLKNNLK
jgi:tetratricopeptide (TPR) repeat protein